MGLTTKKIQVIDEVDHGIYLWKMPNGKVVSDGDNRYFMIQAKKNDQRAIQLLTDAVKSEFGITEGAPFFMAGNRPVTDEEFDEQRQRSLLGLVPDPKDMPAHLDRIHHERRFSE